VGLVEGKHLSVDRSFVEANAAKESRIPREQFFLAATVQNIKRLVRFLSQPTSPVLEVTA
jgi:hypothetical protein